MTELAVQAGGAVVGDATTTGAFVAVGAAWEETLALETAAFVCVAVGLLGPDNVAVGKTVATAGSGVDVTGT